MLHSLTRKIQPIAQVTRDT